MRSTVGALLTHFLTPAGLAVLGALDSSLIFFLPLGIDIALVLAAAREPELFWIYALTATTGSVLGAGGTFWLGRRVGETGLSRWIGRNRLQRIQQRASGKAAAGVAALALIPPPFPFTPIVLASGAFAVDPWRLFPLLAAARLFRFGIESALAARYGQRILQWMDSSVFEITVGAFITLALIGTVLSAINVVRNTRAGR